jgi:hypothetical protein
VGRVAREFLYVISDNGSRSIRSLSTAGRPKEAMAETASGSCRAALANKPIEAKVIIADVPPAEIMGS